MTSWEPLNGLNIHTLAFAFSYALVHAGAKSGTNAGFSTGGGCFGELVGYTPGIGGSDDGEGKGAKVYGVLGMTNGPGSVSTVILVVGTKEDVDELLLPEDELAGLDVGVTEEDNDCVRGVDVEWDQGVDGDDGVVNESEGTGKECESAAAARAAARRLRTAKGHMDVEWGHPVDQFGRTGKG